MPISNCYRETRPNLPERRRIEAVWTYWADRKNTHLVLPDGRMDIILRFRHCVDGKCRDIRPIIAGPTDQPAHIPVSIGDGFVGVRLLPGRAGGFATSAQVFQRRTIGGTEAMGLLPVFENIPKIAPSVAYLAELLEQWIERHLPTEPTRDTQIVSSALDFLHLTGGRESMESAAELSGVSSRQLHRLFLRWVGLSPKTFAGILQFHRALRLLDAGLSIAGTAHEAGYADQAHMTRRFRQLGGFSVARRPALTLARFPLAR